MQILFGGTFDPIHNGHIALGIYISNLFQQKVSFLPITGIPKYKQPPIATTNQRLEMLKIITQKYPDNFDINYSEINLANYSPTIDTLNRINTDGQTNNVVSFIIGADSLVTLDTWDEWESLFDFTNFIVAMRPHYELSNMSDKLNNFIKDRFVSINEFSNVHNGQVVTAEFNPVDIASTNLRKLISCNQNCTDYIDEDVYNYIKKHKIYY